MNNIKYHLTSLRVIYHHLRINAQSPPIPNDKTLHLTLNNTIYTMIGRGSDTTSIIHRLHLFLDPYNGIPYLRYTHEVDE